MTDLRPARRTFRYRAVMAGAWGVGVALGVGAGAWLTVVSGAGAPGSGALEPGTDLIVLPGIAFVVAWVLAFVLGGIWDRLRGSRSRSSED